MESRAGQKTTAFHARPHSQESEVLLNAELASGLRQAQMM